MKSVNFMCRQNIFTAPLALAAALFASLPLAATEAVKAPHLNIGDPAPILQPAKWLKGKPIPQFEKGKVYVVEFWATWCGPCKANIPHLTELAKQYEGKADIIGVDIWESNDPKVNTLPKVTAFVKSQGPKMDYHVAADTLTNRISEAWMKPAGENGIPTAFIIGKDGHIAWIGNPALGLAAALPQILDDKFDVKAARALRDQQNGPANAIAKAISDKDYSAALNLIDSEISRNPAAAPRWSFDRFNVLAHLDLPAFKKQARAALEQTKGDVGTYNMLCAIMAGASDLSPDAYRFGRTLVDEALLKKEREFLFLAMGAAMTSFLGDKKEAVRMQEAAVKAADENPHSNPEFREAMRHTLEKYKTAAGS